LWAEVRKKREYQPQVGAVDNTLLGGVVVREKNPFKGVSMSVEKYLVKVDSENKYVLWNFKNLGIVVKAKLIDWNSDEQYPETALKPISHEQFENIIKKLEVKKL